MTSTLNAVPGGSFAYDAEDDLTTDTYDNNRNTIASVGISNTYDFENHAHSWGCNAGLRWGQEPRFGNHRGEDHEVPCRHAEYNR
jgi:hypothetical protein